MKNIVLGKLVVLIVLTTCIVAGFFVINKKPFTSNLGLTESSNQKNAILQFTSGGQLLGFTDSGIYVGGGDHMLKVDFVNNLPTKPRVEGNVTSPVSTSSQQNKAQPLQKVTYRNVWKGIDITYTATKGGIAESTYYISDTTKANPVEAITLQYNRPVSLDAKGNLITAFETGNITESAPKAWQVIAGQKKPITVAFALKGKQEVGFTIADYEPGHPIIIDPTITWNTFLGGESSTYSYFNMTLDSSNNVYITGNSNATWGTPIRAYTASYDVFVAKLNSSGVLQWNTFLGGASDDFGNSLSVSSGGSVYVGGYSVATWGTPVVAYSAGSDGFVAKLNSSGVLQWNTFLGGAGTDNVLGVVADTGENIFISGQSNATWGSPTVAYTGNYDTFAAKLDSSGALLWSTFMGHAAGYDYSSTAALDSSSNMYIVGTSAATWGSPVRAFGAGSDGFVAKLNSSGVLQWNTFLGTAVGFDEGLGISVDTSGNAFVTGRSGATWGTPVRDYTASNDAFVAKLDSSGALQWNTFLGGANEDYGFTTNFDSSGNVYVGGYSVATWGSPSREITALADGFAAKLDSTGVLQWNTFLGGEGADLAYGIAVDSSNNVFVSGYTADFSWGSPIGSFLGGNNAFVVKLSQTAASVPSSLYSPPLIGPGDMIVIPPITTSTFVPKPTSTPTFATSTPATTTVPLQDTIKEIVSSTTPVQKPNITEPITKPNITWLIQELVSKVKPGQRNNMVKELQTKLKAAGYFSKNFKPTIYFGPMTKAAVKKFNANQVKK